jgi:ribonuclease HI
LKARRRKPEPASTGTPGIRIYTDGGADPNPGRGGWGAVILRPGGAVEELSGGEVETTNNRMELTAAIRALRAVEAGASIDLHTDSQYLRRGITEWLPGWIARGWRRKDGEIKNVDLWRELAGEAARHDVRWHWVRGHSGDRYNERADALATAAIRAGGPAAEAPAAVAGAWEIDVYLRVSASGRDGAWAALVRSDGEDEIRTGVVASQTANQIDLIAACEVLESLPGGTRVAVHTLSDYLRNGASQWLLGWRKRGFVTKDGAAVKNADLWRRLEAALAVHAVSWFRPDRDLAEWEQLEKLLRAVPARS